MPDKTLFISSGTRFQVNLPLIIILKHHAAVRDAIAKTSYIQSGDLAFQVIHASFIYAFNAYKAISLLLPEYYHESGAVVLRQLWEVSLNLHWIAIDVEARAQMFCNYTTMEFRKVLRQSGELNKLAAFDAATARFQKQYRYVDAKGRNQYHPNFATKKVRERANDLGDLWIREYELVYNLTSMHSHGAPGAILQAMFRQHGADSLLLEQNSTALIAVIAIKVMVRNVELLTRLNIIPNARGVHQAYDSFRRTMKTAAQTESK